jgi:hypothetical protein
MNSDQCTPRFPFADWPNPDVPAVAAGVYAIWKDNELIYCGMSGREIDSKGKAAPKKYGLVRPYRNLSLEPSVQRLPQPEFSA